MAFKLKILLCGPAAVGKTSLIYRFIKSKFNADYKLSVGVDIMTKDVEYTPGEIATLSIWDIGGQVRFEFIRSTFYKGAAGVFLVFDLTRADTYDQVTTRWLAEVRQFAGEHIPFVLIGNKLELVQELGEVVDRRAARAFAEEHGGFYIETSSVDGNAVDEAFLLLTRCIVGLRSGADIRPTPAPEMNETLAEVPEWMQTGDLRQYYLENFAFDSDQKHYTMGGWNTYYYETIFPLSNDPSLDQAGITIGARVTHKAGRDIINHIVFRKGEEERLVNCVHTAVCTMTRADILRLQDGLEDAILEHAKTVEDVRVRLTPEEHFVALKSYVAGIAEMGIANTLNASYYSDKLNPEVLPFGFNAAMQKQICTALRELAPAATRGLIANHVAELCDTVPMDWLLSRLKLLDDMYDLKDALLTDAQIFEAIAPKFPLRALKELANRCKWIDPRVLYYLTSMN